jgi:hypothetical protein
VVCFLTSNAAFAMSLSFYEKNSWFIEIDGALLTPEIMQRAVLRYIDDFGSLEKEEVVVYFKMFSCICVGPEENHEII